MTIAEQIVRMGSPAGNGAVPPSLTFNPEDSR